MARSDGYAAKSCGHFLSYSYVRDCRLGSFKFHFPTMSLTWFVDVGRLWRLQCIMLYVFENLSGSTRMVGRHCPWNSRTFMGEA
eukprot:612919-Amphidinium_carterae.1